MNVTQGQEKHNNRTAWIVAGGCLATVICLTCIAVAAIFIYVKFPDLASLPIAGLRVTESPTATLVAKATPSPNLDPSSSGDVAAPTLETAPTPFSTPTAIPLPTLSVNPPPDIDQREAGPLAAESLDRLLEAAYPHQDYFETASRLGGENLGQRTVPYARYQLNDSQLFRVDDELIQAELVAITDHAYFWTEAGLAVNKADVSEAASRLENDYYPRLVNLFGQEWQPGVDNDPHFSILHLVGSDDSDELGYFTNADEFPRTLYGESNEQEIIYLNMARLELGSDLYYGTLVHEMQHLIQWFVDPNENTWLNEGLSQLAEIYLGYDTVDTYEYEQHPEIRLNSWNYDDSKVDAHYAAAYLFSVYFWEQLGDAAVRELSRQPANGMAAVGYVLNGHAPDRSLEQFTADWVATNFLDDPAAGPRYYYSNLDVGRPSLEMSIKDLPSRSIKQLDQFGSHFIDLDVRGPIRVTFVGDTVVDLLDAAPRDGEQIWFAPGVDDADAQLTAAFDLSGLDQATLRFSTWYDLEEGYDFGYVTISIDGGDNWELLRPDHASVGEFGPAFSSQSNEERDAVGGWLKESISLNSYVGQPVLIRFEILTDYETDSSGLGRGFALDDISIPELGYATDVEDGADGWVNKGFVQTGWQLPQQWAVQLIEGGPNPLVRPLTLNRLNQGQWEIEIGKAGGVLAITPLTPFVDDMASYWIHVEQ